MLHKIAWWFLKKEVRGMLKTWLTLGFLKGHRTQVAAAVIAVLTLLLNIGTIDQQQYTAIVGFLTSVGLLTAAVHKPS